MFSPIQITPGMDAASFATSIGENFRQLEAENRTKVITDENGIQRVIIGRYPDGTYGIKVSKPGKDVLTATGDDLIFNSANNLFKIVDADKVTLVSPNSAGSSTFTTVHHGLGYNPTVLAFVSFSPTGTSFPIPYIGPDLVTNNIRYQISMEIDDNDITFYHRDLSGPTNLTDYITYYIVQETAQIQ